MTDVTGRDTDDTHPRAWHSVLYVLDRSLDSTGRTVRLATLLVLTLATVVLLAIHLGPWLGLPAGAGTLYAALRRRPRK